MFEARSKEDQKHVVHLHLSRLEAFTDQKDQNYQGPNEFIHRPVKFLTKLLQCIAN